MSLSSILSKNSPSALPYPSALSTLISSHQQQQISAAAHPAHLQALALTVLHNLQYQHDWTDLQVHTVSPLDLPPDAPAAQDRLLPRPLVSGMPPQRLYLHPDDQLALLAADRKAERDQEPWIARLRKPRREWVLPTHLREKWSLSKFAEVFDAIGLEPPKDTLPEEEHPGSKETAKRLLLATVSDDSTIVYYIVHDGIVKPRQN